MTKFSNEVFVNVVPNLKTLSKQNYKIPAGNYIFKVNKRNTRTRCETRRRSDVFIVDFEHISHLVLVILWLNLSR